MIGLLTSYYLLFDWGINFPGNCLESLIVMTGWWHSNEISSFFGWVAWLKHCKTSQKLPWKNLICCQCTLQNILNIEWLRDFYVFLDLIFFISIIYSFGPKSKDNPLKFFHQLQDIVQISRQLNRAHPKSDIFLGLLLLRHAKAGV